MLCPLAVTPGVTHFGAYHRPPDGHLLNIDICPMPFFTLSFQIACEREQSQTGYNFHHEYGVALFPPHPHIDLSDAVSRLYSPSLFYRCCLLKISSSPNIIKGLSQIFITTITMMTMAVLCQDRDLTCPFPARVLTFM